MTLRVSEVYLSIQGEGPRVGKRTVFVRFGGCNLRCPGWPCDTPHAIDPKLYRNEWEPMEADDLVERIHTAAHHDLDTVICFTGGEPFLQKHSELAIVSHKLADMGYINFECFSNGTILYPDWAFDVPIHFIMDWKLSGSGEDPNNVIRFQNLAKLDQRHAVKFVIKDHKDFTEAVRIYTENEKFHNFRSPEVYYGKVWSKSIRLSELTDWVLKAGLPWRLNVQLHNYIWPPHERGR